MATHAFDFFWKGYKRTGFKQDLVLVIRFTRNWIHYGCLLHVFLFALAAATQGILRSGA
jgi:hypothetical protein